MCSAASLVDSRPRPVTSARHPKRLTHWPPFPGIDVADRWLWSTAAYWVRVTDRIGYVALCCRGRMSAQCERMTRTVARRLGLTLTSGLKLNMSSTLPVQLLWVMNTRTQRTL